MKDLLPTPSNGVIDGMQTQLFDNSPITRKRSLLTVIEVASYLNVSPRTIRDWVFKRKIPYRKPNGCLRFSQEDIENWSLPKQKE